MGQGITIEAPGLSKFERFYLEFPKVFGGALSEWEGVWAMEAASRIRDRAPVETGEYRSSIVAVGNVVVSDHPAARRLELGFIGVDSLGRHYAQMPNPHWSPVKEEIHEEIRKNIVGLTMKQIRKALNG